MPDLISPMLGVAFNEIGATGKEAFIVAAIILAVILAFIMHRLEDSRVGHAFTPLDKMR